MVASLSPMPDRIYPRRQPRLFLAERRDEAGLTQQQVADRLGTSDVTVSRWETGKEAPGFGRSGGFR